VIFVPCQGGIKLGVRKLNIKKEDRVVVLNGKDRGRIGRVLAVFPKSDTLLVERINLMKHHSKRGGSMGQQGGIIEKEVPIHISNVMLICPRCNSQARTYRKQLETGFRVRVCRKCNEVVETQ
jgi:large subunit ribosomal protein L24